MVSHDYFGGGLRFSTDRFGSPSIFHVNASHAANLTVRAGPKRCFRPFIVCFVVCFARILRESALGKRKTKHNNNEKQRLGPLLLQILQSAADTEVPYDKTPIVL